MIKAIILDDESHCRQFLAGLLREYCPDVQVMAATGSAAECHELVERMHPDIVFLDIEMPEMSGFDWLEQFDPVPFDVIFTTGYNQYAIRALHFSALDYLMKPVDPEELQHAVRKVVDRKGKVEKEQFEWMRQKMRGQTEGFHKIAIPTAEGFELVPAIDVLYMESNSNYTYIVLKNRPRIIACRTLKEMEQQLQDFPSMLRVHNSFIVNLNEVSRYVRGEGGYLVMSDGTSVNVSRSRKEALLRFF